MGRWSHSGYGGRQGTGRCSPSKKIEDAENNGPSRLYFKFWGTFSTPSMDPPEYMDRAVEAHVIVAER